MYSRIWERHSCQHADLNNLEYMIVYMNLGNFRFGFFCLTQFHFGRLCEGCSVWPQYVKRVTNLYMHSQFKYFGSGLDIFDQPLTVPLPMLNLPLHFRCIYMFVYYLKVFHICAQNVSIQNCTFFVRFILRLFVTL